jgi:hypothetical protein
MDEIVEVVAALLVLGAFAGSQVGRMDQHKVPYLMLNLVGTAVLAWLAGVERSWGFLLLEGVWALISGVALLALLRRRRSGLETA